MKPDYKEEYQRGVFELEPEGFHPAFHRSLLEARSFDDFRDSALITQSEPAKNGGILSPLRKPSDTLKRRKSNTSCTTEERSGSISSDSGQGSMSDGVPSTYSHNKSVVSLSAEQTWPHKGQNNDHSMPSNTKIRLPFKIPYSRRFSSPATSPTKVTFGDDVPFGPAQPTKSNLKTIRPRGLSWPDVKGWDNNLAHPRGDNRTTNQNIRLVRGFGVPCLEEVEEECHLAADTRKCFALTHPVESVSRHHTTVLISDHNHNELELIELNKLLDKETLRTSAAILDEEGMTILHRAVQNGFVALAKFLITRGVSTELKDRQGWTALCLALEKGDLLCAEMLVKLGANVNYTNRRGETILHRMAQQGDYNAIQFLVKHGAQLDKEDDKGWPALHYALKRKDLKCAALLMTSGANIHRYTERRVEEYSISMEIVNIGKVKLDGSLQRIDRNTVPEVTIIWRTNYHLVSPQ